MRFKCQMLVSNVLVQDAYLEVRFVVNQKAQSRFHSSITIDKRFDSVNHTVVGDATLHDVVASPRQSIRGIELIYPFRLLSQFSKASTTSLATASRLSVCSVS